MSEDFKPGTRPLLRLAGLDAERPFVSRDDENDALWTTVLALMMRLYLEPDPESRRAGGPTDAQVVAGMRTSLAENFGLESGDYLAWALVHYGCRQKPTLASLPIWEGLMFEWQERRATAPRIALMLRAAGLGATLPAASLESLDGWIANPATALGDGPKIVETLFGPRLVKVPLTGEEPPAHDALFFELARSAPPPVAMESLRQRRHPGGDARWVVEYVHGGHDWAFDTTPAGAALDVDAVMQGVDALFERAGRPERVFRLAPGRTTDVEHGWFIVADGVRFDELATRLRLPVLRGPVLPAPVVAPPVAEGATGAASTAPDVAREGAATELPAVGDAPSTLDSGYATMMPVATDPDAAMRALITSLRRSFGAGRLLQASRWVSRSRVDAPAWIAASKDPVAIVYTRFEPLIRKGRIVWGALVEADPALLAPGDDDRPMIVLTSTDDYYDGRPAELAAVGARLADLKAARPGSGELREIAVQIRNDGGRPLGVPLPAALGTRDVVLTSAMGIRAHLPDGVLSAAWFPMLTHSASEVPLVVPCALWPQGLRAAWDARRLGAPT